MGIWIFIIVLVGVSFWLWHRAPPDIETATPSVSGDIEAVANVAGITDALPSST